MQVADPALRRLDLKERVDHVRAEGRTKDLTAARKGSVAGSAASAGLEESRWLCPIEDRRRLDSTREGMPEGFSLGNYLLLVDYTGRLFREGKATISGEVAAISERLGTTAETWQGFIINHKSLMSSSSGARHWIFLQTGIATRENLGFEKVEPG